jgi:hypothetical protein
MKKTVLIGLMAVLVMSVVAVEAWGGGLPRRPTIEGGDSRGPAPTSVVIPGCSFPYYRWSWDFQVVGVNEDGERCVYTTGHDKHGECPPPPPSSSDSSGGQGDPDGAATVPDGYYPVAY